ncbi:MAG: alpha/beta fold hydrolase [Actinomycetota bacterium]|nr:alpha/beta fold hydrolase [Actinomycetota bacterium]
MQRATVDGGVELEYELRGHGDPVLLIHGSHIARSYLELTAQPALAERYTLIRYHRRGHLGSTPPQGPVSIADQADDARGLLDHLGVGRAHIVGHSSGGAIALQLAADAPDRTQSLVLMEPAVLQVPLGKTVKELNAYAEERYRQGDWEAAEDLFLGGPGDRASLARSVPGGIEQALRDMDTYFSVEMPALDAWTFDATDAERLQAPVLYVLGADTQALYVEILDLIRRWLPQTETTIVAGATHLLHMQQPEVVADALRHFFDRHRIVATSPSTGRVAPADRYNAAADLLDGNLERGRADHPAIATLDGVHTYGDLAVAANRAGNALRELGVVPGDRVLIALLDTPDFAATVLGAVKLGAVPVPVGTDLPSDEYAHLLDDSQARVAVASAPAAESLREARRAAGRLRHIVLTSEPAGDELLLEEVTGAVEAELSPGDTSDGDACFWLYATGRSHRPTRVVHRQRVMRLCADAYGRDVLGLGPDDVTFSVSKLHTAYGFGGGLYLPLAAGATTVLIAEPVLPRVVADVGVRFSPTVLFALPSTYAALLTPTRSGEGALRSVRRYVSSGGHLPGGVLERWRGATGLEILEGYGLPESGHIFISARPGDVRPDCMGTVLDGYEARITDGNGRDVPPGRPGRLLVRGLTISLPEDGGRPDGWLDTGEVCAIGDAGHVYHRGRGDDAVAAGGMLVSLRQIEGVLRDDGRVRECTVLGRPDDDGLVKPEAFVVLAPGADPQVTADALRQRVRQRLGGERTPRRFHVVDALPPTGTRVIRSPYGDVELSEMSLTAFVLGRAVDRGDKPALVDGVTNRAISYRELADAVGRVGAALAARGVVKGDVLALFSPNCPEFVITYYAAMSLGAVVTTINPLTTAHDMARQLEHADARWLATTPQLMVEKGRDAGAAAGVRETFVFGEADGATPFASLLEGDHPAPSADVGPDDLALLPYSSGTTGLPKGVVLTHRHLVANLCQTRAVHRVRTDDVVIAVLPLFHIYGMQVTLNLALCEGATVVIPPRFELEGFLRLVQEQRVTRAELVPPIVLALAKQPAVDDFDLSSLKIITSAAAPLGADLARACADRLGCRVKQAYGMTEFGGATHFAPDSGRDDPESIGPALPGVECRLVDADTGFEAAPGEPGELLVRAPGTMLGYLNNVKATAETIGPDGWLRTGDLVTVDEEGWFRVADRLKELIKYKGNQVAPAELESVLLTHPAVADVAVIASPDPDAGEVPMAFVVLRSPTSAAELMRYVADRVAPYKKVRRLEFVDEIPKSPSGKILRRTLVERERATRADAFATAER